MYVSAIDPVLQVLQLTRTAWVVFRRFKVIQSINNDLNRCDLGKIGLPMDNGLSRAPSKQDEEEQHYRRHLKR